MFGRWTPFVLTCVLVVSIISPLSRAAADDAATQAVAFSSAVYPPTPFQIRRARKLGKKPEPTIGQKLTGHLTKPKGDGPFAAIVLMHGCHGIGTWNQIWSDRLVRWGYVVLDVDSFRPRGHASVCGRPTVVAGPTRALDAHGAAQFLARQPFVNPKQIGVMGMSHGGWSTLNAINSATTTRLRSQPFRAAVALYPWCEGPVTLDAPVLILSAGLDAWTPADKCRAFIKQVRSDHAKKLKVYPKANHMFDVPGLDKVQLGHTLRHDPASESDAIARVRAFLAEQL